MTDNSKHLLGRTFFPSPQEIQRKAVKRVLCGTLGAGAVEEVLPERGTLPQLEPACQDWLSGEILILLSSHSLVCWCVLLVGLLV